MFLFTLVVAELMLALAAFLAYVDGYWNKFQVALYHSGRGLPFTGHAMMFMDSLLISPMIAWIVAKHSSRWKLWQCLACFATSLVLSGFMHFVSYANDAKRKPTFVHHNGRLTPSGWVHFLYMAGAMAVILLFYFASPTTVKQAAVISILLGIHVAVVTIQPAYHLGLKEMFNPEAVRIIVVSWIGLGVLFGKIVLTAK